MATIKRPNRKKEFREKVQLWLKYLKDRVQPQPKQEWGEEDEIRLTNIIIMLKEGASLHFNKKDITKAVDWLKSIRPYKQWKPSKEQMEALWNVYEGGEKQSALASLYNDLKEL